MVSKIYKDINLSIKKASINDKLIYVLESEKKSGKKELRRFQGRLIAGKYRFGFFTDIVNGEVAVIERGTKQIGFEKDDINKNSDRIRLNWVFANRKLESNDVSEGYMFRRLENINQFKEHLLLWNNKKQQFRNELSSLNLKNLNAIYVLKNKQIASILDRQSKLNRLIYVLLNLSNNTVNLNKSVRFKNLIKEVNLKRDLLSLQLTQNYLKFFYLYIKIYEPDRILLTNKTQKKVLVNIVRNPANWILDKFGLKTRYKIHNFWVDNNFSLSAGGWAGFNVCDNATKNVSLALLNDNYGVNNFNALKSGGLLEPKMFSSFGNLFSFFKLWRASFFSLSFFDLKKESETFRKSKLLLLLNITSICSYFYSKLFKGLFNFFSLLFFFEIYKSLYALRVGVLSSLQYVEHYFILNRIESHSFNAGLGFINLKLNKEKEQLFFKKSELRTLSKLNKFKGLVVKKRSNVFRKEFFVRKKNKKIKKVKYVLHKFLSNRYKKYASKYWLKSNSLVDSLLKNFKLKKISVNCRVPLSFAKIIQRKYRVHSRILALKRLGNYKKRMLKNRFNNFIINFERFIKNRKYLIFWLSRRYKKHAFNRLSRKYLRSSKHLPRTFRSLKKYVAFRKLTNRKRLKFLDFKINRFLGYLLFTVVNRNWRNWKRRRKYIKK